MSELIVSRAPLSLNQQRFIVKRVTLNKSYAKIVEEFGEHFGRRINQATIMRLKQKNIGAIISSQKQIVEQGVIQATSLKQQSYRLLERRMNVAEDDVTELDKLRTQFRNEEITAAEYKTKRDMYEELTVSELVTIANAAHTHGKADPDQPAAPGDGAAAQMLADAIRSGNTISLVQMLNPTFNTGNRPA